MRPFAAGRSVPPTAPCGADSHLTRRVFHGAFSGGEATRPTLPFDTMTNTLYDTPSHRELVLDSAPTADGVVLYHPEHTGPDQPEHWLISDVFVERTEAR